MHPVAPVLFWYLPSTQREHLPCPGAFVTLPGWQARQLRSLLLPGIGLALPASHLVHALLAASEKEPLTHGAHDSEPAPAERPASHAVQPAALVFDHVPPSHLVHALLPGSE